MTDPQSARPSASLPPIAAPRAFHERRIAHRRAEDRQAHEEKVLLAKTLDVLAADATAEDRLGGLLRLLASTVGARRAAVLADGGERRAAAAVGPGEDPAAAQALAAWLDARSARSRVERAAAGQAPVWLVLAPGRPLPTRPAGAEEGAAEGERAYAMVPVPTAGDVVLGFEFASAAAADRLAERLPVQLARHAAVALSLVTHQLATEREIASLRAAEAERAQFVSTVAHELRTPLTGLRGYLELILDGQVSDPEVELDFLQRSRGIVESMSELVGDLLELSRIESGNLSLALEPFSVAEAASDVADRLLPIALERRVELVTSLPPKLRSATGDRRRVEQILTNLAANALKFTDSGGSVEVLGRFDGPVAIMAVRDDGSGIADEDQPRIFERFHRLAAHDRVTGTGLGLPIARDLARQMKGDLDVASVPGVGSAFVLALPGPTPVEASAVLAALRRALATERSRLEERGILRRAARATGDPEGRSLPAGRDRLSVLSGRTTADAPDGGDGGRGAGAPDGPSGSARLRALGPGDRGDSRPA